MAVVYFISPYTRIRLAGRAAAAGRSRWAADILEGRRWANASLPIYSLPVLIVIAALAFVAFGYLDWRSLVDPARAGASREGGPWRTIHIIGRAQLYALSCAGVLWWISTSTQRIKGLSALRD